MTKKTLGFSLAAIISISTIAQASDLQAEIDSLKEKLSSLEKKLSSTNKKLNKVKAHDAFDNIKFGVDFRNTIEKLDYKNNETGVEASNNSLLTSRLYLTMASSPVENLTFRGKLAVYSTWGGHIYDESIGLKDWSASSKATDTVMRIKEAYFVYNTEYKDQPISFSVGRRPSTTGFLANYRANEEEPGSPLAHITNMEVNGAMMKLDLDRFVEGSYVKFVLGRAHTGDTTGVYGKDDDAIPLGVIGAPYATDDINNGDDKDVDFFVMPGSAYDNGTYKVMYEWAHIFNTKGQRYNDPTTKKAAAGEADLLSLGMLIDGFEGSDMLEETKAFISVGYTKYNAKDGYQLLGSSDGGTRSGNSIWLGVIFPDTFTDSGKIGLEYNHGSKYWTPMTWAEDTAIGSKVAVRGDAYELYWNFNLFGMKNLPAQLRYTRLEHEYTPNLNCAGWVAPEEVDITAENIRFAITYKY